MRVFFYTQREWCNVEIENETNIGEGLSLLIDAAVDSLQEILPSHSSSYHDGF